MEVKKVKGGEFDPGNFVQSWIRCWKEVVLRPRQFFDIMPTDGGYRNPLFFALICWVIGGILSAVVRTAPANIILLPITSFIGLFIMSAILHL